MIVKQQLLVILQARMSSSRFPGKVLASLNGKPMIFWQISRIKCSKYVSKIVVATSNDQTDDELALYLKEIGVDVIRGDLEDVYDRFRKVLDHHQFPYFVRLTADCPLVMPELIDIMFEKFIVGRYDYISNAINPTFPDGLDVEILKTEIFKRIIDLNLSRSEREHVTLAIYTRKNSLKIFSFESSENNCEERWVVDYPEDLIFIKNVYSKFEGREIEFTLNEVKELLSHNPNLRNKIGGNYRNVSLTKGIGAIDSDHE
jgi:spore coat polysaccharide biosynthesis protein SpsF